MPPRSAIVLFKDVPAARLVELPDGRASFAYKPDWATPIGCSLPLDQQVHVSKAGLHPFFQHLTAEGWMRELQARAGRTEGSDDFGLLLQYGLDCIGAVGIRPEDWPEEPATLADPMQRAATQGHRTVSGAQRKLLAYKQGRQVHAARADTPATHIAKFNDQSETTFVLNESTTLRLAVELLGADEVTRFEVATLDGFDETALVVERFDRTPDGGKLRLEDFAQVLSVPRGFDFRGKYDGDYEAVAEAIRRHSARGQIDVLKFFRRLIVNCLVGNADAHLKNFSLLERPEGLRLSPAYDMLNTLWYGSRYEGFTALRIGGTKPQLDAIDRALLTDFGLRIGLTRAAVSAQFTDLKKRFAAGRVLARIPGAPRSEFMVRYDEIVRNQALRILL